MIPPRLVQAGLIGGWLLATGAAIGVHALDGTPSQIVATLLEAVVYLAVLLGLGSWGPLRALVTALSAPRKLILAGIGGLLLFAQLADRPDWTYPATSWAMYSEPPQPDDFVFFDYEGRTQDGRAVSINPSRVIPSVQYWYLSLRLSSLARRALAGDEEAGRRLVDMVAALGRAHNLRHPKAAVRTIVVYRYEIDPRRPAPSSVVPREAVWGVAVP